ncbi:actin beta/gamma 1 [Angomonas deanei]|nr:actin beta/gamma 1 [Angomonas deanei]|eukprot:EPY40773.1 actin beta/gamma 1 [Angomonas deanei]
MSNKLRSAVIDVGAYHTKCGFSGEEAPREVFRSAVGVPRHQGLHSTTLGYRSDIVSGSELESEKGLFSVRHPVEGGRVTSWADLEELLYYSLYNRLEVEPEQTPVLYVSPAGQSRPDREKVAELFFESFNVPLLGFLNSASATVFSTGRTTGLSLDSGASQTTVAAVVEGVALRQSMRTTSVAGNLLTSDLFHCLKQKGYTLSTEKDWDLVNTAKEQCCRVSVNVEEDNRQLSEVGPRIEDAYTLPDDERLFLFEYQFMLPERLFDPSLLEGDDPPRRPPEHTVGVRHYQPALSASTVRLARVDGQRGGEQPPGGAG